MYVGAYLESLCNSINSIWTGGGGMYDVDLRNNGITSFIDGRGNYISQLCWETSNSYEYLYTVELYLSFREVLSAVLCFLCEGILKTNSFAL